jgi:hypothetical protein
MKPDDRFEAWKRRRAAVEVPAGFADRILLAVAAQDKNVRSRAAFRSRLAVLLFSQPGKIGLGTLAGLVCLLRVLHVVAVFIP